MPRRAWSWRASRRCRRPCRGRSRAWAFATSRRCRRAPRAAEACRERGPAAGRPKLPGETGRRPRPPPPPPLSPLPPSLLPATPSSLLPPPSGLAIAAPPALSAPAGRGRRSFAGHVALAGAAAGLHRRSPPLSGHAQLLRAECFVQRVSNLLWRHAVILHICASHAAALRGCGKGFGFRFIPGARWIIVLVAARCMGRLSVLAYRQGQLLGVQCVIRQACACCCVVLVLIMQASINCELHAPRGAQQHSRLSTLTPLSYALASLHGQRSV